MIHSSKTLMHTLSAASIAGAFLLIVIYGAHAAQVREPHAQAAETASVALAVEPATITGKAAIVYDLHTKEILFAKNADMRLPLASLTKLMSAEAVLSAEAPDQEVTITRHSLSPEGDWGFRVGESWKLGDLIKFGLVASSNDAMAAAAESLGSDTIDRMNARAKELGLAQTYFFNPTGLDVDGETAGAYGSAHDVAMLAASFLQKYPAEFEATAHPRIAISSPTHMLEATSTAGPLLDIPGLIGAKTGYTDLAGGNLVAAVDIGVGRPVIVAVLGSTRDGRFADVKTLIEATQQLFIAQH